MAKIICVLYDDPVDGYPKTYARDDIPKIERYPGGQTLPTPKAASKPSVSSASYPTSAPSPPTPNSRL